MANPAHSVVTMKTQQSAVQKMNLSEEERKMWVIFIY